MERMNPLDASFLHLEDGVTHLHVGACAVFEGPPPPFDALFRAIEAKLPLVPRYRQRARFVPLQLGPPVWVDDPDFRLENHLFHVTLPGPGDDEQLAELTAGIMEVELDRTRPLWGNWVVEGLAGDRWALIAKVHHCMVDGVAGAGLMDVMLDHEPDPLPPPADTAEPWAPERPPSDARLLADALVALAASPLAAYRAARRLTDLRGLAGGARTLVSAMRPTPSTSISGRIGRRRRWTWATAELADVKAIRATLGGTVNDVVLSAVTGGFRALLLSRGEPVESLVIRSLIPVSVRTPERDGECHNYVSAMFAELPVGVADPVERLAAVRAHMGDLKASHEADVGSALVGFAEAVPPPLVALGERAAVRISERVTQPAITTVATNVPGPQYPLYACGRRMTAYRPYVPISSGVRIGVAILSYDGHVAFGVTGDRESAPDIGVLAAAIEGGIADLLSAARRARDSELATTTA